MEAKGLIQVKSKKSKAVLHKPFENIGLILNEIRAFNKDLHLCCLLTYGCLLRPHREIRELKWGDFSNDLHQISLSGGRNKSGRNRIVPVPEFVREILSGGEADHNIFTNAPQSRNPDLTILKHYGAGIKDRVYY